MPPSTINPQYQFRVLGEQFYQRSEGDLSGRKLLTKQIGLGNLTTNVYLVASSLLVTKYTLKEINVKLLQS